MSSLAELKEMHLGLAVRARDLLLQKSVFEVLPVLAAEHRLIHRFAMELGAVHLEHAGFSRPSVPFAFAMLGSGARDEQCVSSDQDHALIYEEEESQDRIAQTRSYFERLCNVTAALLHEIGYPLCTGNVMASNARWRGTVVEWRDRLAQYNAYPDWGHIRFLLIACDAVPICGDVTLMEDMRGEVIRYIARSPFMRWKIADQGMASRVALTMLGGIRTESSGDRKGMLQIKDGLYTPLVNAVRLWALSVGIELPSTVKRVDRLQELKVWGQDLALSVREALKICLELRLHLHTSLAVQGVPVHDFVDVDILSESQKEGLKRALRTAKHLQQLTVRHFPRSG